jgi:hypothetical protein
MKDIKVHNIKNLMSIKSVEDNLTDRKYFESIVTLLYSQASENVSIEASRPNYNIISLTAELKSILKDYGELNYSNSEISFYVNSIKPNLLEFLPQIWFAYEHVSLCFFKNVDLGLDLGLSRKPWFEITENFSSYVLFKGIEEDTLWIGKSEELEFNIR